MAQILMIQHLLFTVSGRKVKSILLIIVSLETVNKDFIPLYMKP